MQLAGIGLLIGLLTGCRATSDMLDHGWDIHSVALAGGGQAEPVATKEKNGNLVVAFEVSDRHCGPFGGESGGHFRKGTNVVYVTDLRAVTNFVAVAEGDDIGSALGTHTRFVAQGQPLPIAPKRGESASWRGPYPNFECLLYDYGWVWCVPPTDDGTPLRAYAVPRETYRTPAYAYPLRIVWLPISLVADLTLWPWMH